jgi:D-amino peptidase
MKKAITLFISFIALFALAFIPGSKEKLKVYISVDMEGVAGVVSSRECSSTGSDYHYFRELMTLETNAAIEGALKAGATEIVVCDGHGSKTNILPDLLHEKAKLLRGKTSRPENMMLGIDESFDAVIFIGYHAKAGTEKGILSHTSTGNVIDLSINGVSMPEAGYNALIAGLYQVPVLLVSGDNWICSQVKDLIDEVVTVETKIGMGTAALGIHPELVRQKIRSEVTAALKRRDQFHPFQMTPPYHMDLKVKKEGELYPGAQKVGPGEFTFTCSEFLIIMDAFNAMK